MPRWTHLIQHEIKTLPGIVIHHWPFWVLETRCQAIEDEVARMLQEGIIEKSTSPWFSLIIVAPKTDRSLRLCNDFRRLNAVSEFDSYPLLWVDDLIEWLERSLFFSLGPDQGLMPGVPHT